jgi:hypothetical protein
MLLVGFVARVNKRNQRGRPLDRPGPFEGWPEDVEVALRQKSDRHDALLFHVTITRGKGCGA